MAKTGLRGSFQQKSAKSSNFYFLQKKGLYMWVDHVSKYYKASSTISLLNWGFYIIYFYILYIQRSFEYCAPRLFNHLPFEIRASDSIAEFKKKLKNFLFRESNALSNLVIHTSFAV